MIDAFESSMTSFYRNMDKAGFAEGALMIAAFAGMAALAYVSKRALWAFWGSTVIGGFSLGYSCLFARAG